MKTKLLMTSSSVILGSIGIVLSFFPDEIINYFNLNNSTSMALIFQLLGALYLGFAMLNWMAKGTIIGGIYNKPIVIGNLMHFGVGGIALAKMITSIELHQEIFMTLTIIYAVFALSFALILRPTLLKNSKS